VLDQLGISADGRVATFAWNTARHLELYFAPPCTGRVLHTLNLRLFPEQLTYIVEPCRGRGDLRRQLDRACCGRRSTTFPRCATSSS
jgi:acyl-CoA synthetase (AMP-forming)/AMP-acid ligase II